MLNFLLHYWFMLLAVPMFAAGAVADPAVGAEVSEGGEDVGDVTPEADVDTGAELETETPEAEAVGEEALPEGQSAQDNRTLSAPVRKALSDLKATNPEGYKQVKAAVWSDREFRQLFPEGATQAQQLLNQLDEIGGFDAVEELNGEVQDYRQLDTQWINGDPEFINTAVKAFPDGFKKLMPKMLDTYANVDRDGYNREMARVVAATLNAGQIPTTLYLLKRVFNSSQDQNLKTEGLQLVAGVEQFMKGISDEAAKRPQETVNPKTEELSQREQQIAEREREQLFSNIGSKSMAFQRGEIIRSLKDYAKGQAVTEGVSGAIVNEVIRSVMAQLGADEGFNTKYDRYIDAGDMQGALKLLNTRAKQVIPEHFKKIAPKYFRQPKLGGKPNGQKPNADKGKAAAAPQGWTKVSGPPSMDQIDRSKTDRGMIFHNQAILSSGKKVYWGDRAPSA